MRMIVDDIRVFYKACARGGSPKRPLLLLHGNGGSHHSFDGVIERLSQYRDCYAIDARGQGRTGRGKKPLTYRTLGEDAVAFVNALGLVQPDIIGYSDGGIAALEYATLTGNVGKIVTLGANWDETGMTADFIEWVEQVFRKTRPWRWLPFVARRRELLQLMVAPSSYDSWEKLEKIQTEVMLMVGDADVIPRTHTDRMAKALPNARICVVADCGHRIMREQTETFLQQVYKFLESKPSGR